QTELRLESQIRPDVYPPQRIWIFAIERLAVRAVVAGLDANVVRTFLVPASTWTDGAIVHSFATLSRDVPGFNYTKKEPREGCSRGSIKRPADLLEIKPARRSRRTR